MNKKELIIVAMASSKNADYSPVQIQKLIFLLDMKIPKYLDGPHFNFVAYDYGPFCGEIYQILEECDVTGEVNIIRSVTSGIRMFRLTNRGQEIGTEMLSKLEPKIREYIGKLSDFVRTLSFAELVSTIYNEYPEMKKNSVFREIK